MTPRLLLMVEGGFLLLTDVPTPQWSVVRRNGIMIDRGKDIK